MPRAPLPEGTAPPLAPARTRARKSPARTRVAPPAAAPTDTSPGYLRAISLSHALLEARGRAPTPVQLAAFEALATREDLLLVSPTGTGKTHAVMLPLLSALCDPLPDAHFPPLEGTRSVRVLYLSPLRALAQQQSESLARDALELSSLHPSPLAVTVAARTGDSDAAARAQLAKDPPGVLVLTPESLAVVLATRARESLACVHEVVLDEVHQLAAGKRGALLASTLETLGYFLATRGTPRPRRVALSATAHPAELLARWIAGSREPAARVLVAEPARAPRVELVVPEYDAPFPSPGWTSRKLLPAVARAVASCEGTTLVFAASRPRVERWTQALRDVLPPRMQVGCFHGSMSADERGLVRVRLALGELRAVVATSGLEAGVDLPNAEQVLVLGAPATVTQLVQSAGRSAHRPGETPLARLAPTDACELLACVAARQCSDALELEPVPVRSADLDVAVQGALALCALGEPVSFEDLRAALTAAAPFGALSNDDVRAVLDHLRTGGDALAAYDEARRIDHTPAGFTLSGAASRSSYLRGIGTILEEPAVPVQTQGRLVGRIDGRFAALLEPGDRFALAGSVWRVVLRTNEAIEALRDPHHRGAPARWSGSRQARSEAVAARMESLLGALDARTPREASHDEAARKKADEAALSLLALAPHEAPAARALVSLVLAQRARSIVPSPERFVVEVLRERGRTHLVLHTFAGAGANEVLGRALALRWSRARGDEHPVGSDGAELACTDEGLVVTVRFAPKNPAELEALLRRSLAPEGLYEESLRTLDGGSLARSHFREVARIAQLTPSSGRPGAASPSLLYDVLRKHAPSHLLLRALSHTLWSALDGARAVHFLGEIARREWHLVACTAPSPLAIPVFARGDARRDRLAPDDLDGALVEAAHALYLRSGGEAAMP